MNIRVVVLTALVTGLAPVAASAQPDVINTRQVGAPGGNPSTELRCPDGSLLAGYKTRHGEWLARITIVCRAVSPTGRWGGEAFDGPSLGGDGGDHVGTFECEGNTFVAAFSAMLVHIFDSDEIFIAHPHFTCVGLRSGTTMSIGGPLGSSRQPKFEYYTVGNSAIGGDFGCAKGWAARGIMTRAGGADDVDRLGLVCEDRTQYASIQQAPRSDIETYTPTPVDPRTAGPSGNTTLNCPNRQLHLVGWEIDPSATGVRRVETLCAPVTPGVGWSESDVVPGELLIAPGAQTETHRYLCPLNSVVVGWAQFRRPASPPGDVTPICKSELDGSGTRVRSTGIVAGPPFDQYSSECIPGTPVFNLGTIDGYALIVTWTPQNFYFRVGCSRDEIGDAPNPRATRPSRGGCAERPELCATLRVPPPAPPAPPAPLERHAPPPPTPVPAPAAPPAAPPGPADGGECARNGDVFRVLANVAWCNTGIKLSGGEQISLSAKGQWSNAGPPSVGPSGFVGYKLPGTVLATGDLASLIGRVGDRMFAAGARHQSMNDISGNLYLSINDVPGTFEDNQGYVSVLVQIIKR